MRPIEPENLKAMKRKGLTYEVRYNRSRREYDTYEETEAEARSMIDPRMPWSAEVVELIYGEYNRHVLTLFLNSEK